MGEVDSSTILSIPPSDQNQVCAAHWGSAGLSAPTLSTGVPSDHSCLSDAFLPFPISQSLWRASMGGSLGLEGMVCPRAWRAMTQVSKQPLEWDLERSDSRNGLCHRHLDTWTASWAEVPLGAQLRGDGRAAAVGIGVFLAMLGVLGPAQQSAAARIGITPLPLHSHITVRPAAEEVDVMLQRCEGGVDAALQYAKNISKYMKDLIGYLEKRTALGETWGGGEGRGLCTVGWPWDGGMVLRALHGAEGLRAAGSGGGRFLQLLACVEEGTQRAQKPFCFVPLHFQPFSSRNGVRQRAPENGKQLQANLHAGGTATIELPGSEMSRS